MGLQTCGSIFFTDYFFASGSGFFETIHPEGMLKKVLSFGRCVRPRLHLLRYQGSLGLLRDHFTQPVG
jgi:branched-subunit amino acid aminotransferase/4-amino-4-deoxychorismate lyase